MSASAAVIDSYDAVLFDLDGVIYLGPVAVPTSASSPTMRPGRPLL